MCCSEQNNRHSICKLQFLRSLVAEHQVETWVYGRNNSHLAYLAILGRFCKKVYFHVSLLNLQSCQCVALESKIQLAATISLRVPPHLSCLLCSPPCFKVSSMLTTWGNSGVMVLLKTCEVCQKRVTPLKWFCCPQFSLAIKKELLTFWLLQKILCCATAVTPVT